MLFNVVVIAGVFITLLTAIPVIRQLRHHPRGLFVLFFAEMWERFSYYGMRGLLIFYLTQHLLFDDTFANGQYGAYTSLVYLLPLIGGFLADRYLGTRKAIAFGALLLVAGHLTMAVEGRPARQFLDHGGQRFEFQLEGRADNRQARLLVAGKAYEFGPGTAGGLEIKGIPAGAPIPNQLPAGSYQTVEVRDEFFKGIFYFALSLIIMGVGFLKPNISSLVGQLYSKGDPRRDPGFTLYYYGINLGSFWAAVLCGLLGQTVGWWAGFGLAGIGMLLGYLVFIWGRPLLEGHGEPPDPQHLTEPFFGPLNREVFIYVCALMGVGVVWVLVQRYAVVGSILAAGSAVVMTYLAWFMVQKCTKAERQQMMLALLLVAGAVVFFTLFEQAGSSLNLFANRNTQLPNDGFMTVTAAQVQSFNAGFILLFAPLFSFGWAYLAQRGRDPDPLKKFGLGLIQVGLGFFVLVWGASFADASFRVPLLFLAVTYLFHTTGELCLSPVGLSQITKLSPPLVVATLMATWFLASSWAQWVGALIAQLAGTETVGGQVLDGRLALQTSIDVFAMLGWLGVGAGCAFLVASPFLRHWAHGANDTEAHDQTLPRDGSRSPSDA
ncbi:MAG: peptide MFS transporter [Sphingosinicella sp.]|nr:peptide MFS transporter [Sphingosinicella sp.]